MFVDDDGWFDTTGVPLQLLIRMKYTYELDVLIATVTQRAVTPRLPDSAGRIFARSVTAIAAKAVSAGRAQPQQLPAEQLRAFVLAMDDDYPRCGTVPHIPRPPWWVEGTLVDKPDPTPWRESGLAEVSLVIAAAARLVAEVGSEELQRDLGAALDDTLASLQETRNAHQLQ